MGNTVSNEKLKQAEPLWAVLPDVAVRRLFANMNVSTVLRVLEHTTNDYIIENACSNLVWKERYRKLFFEEDVQSVIQLIENASFDNDEEDGMIEYMGLRNWMTRASYLALLGLMDFHENDNQNTRRPHGYYLVHFLLIWSVMPHAWTQDQGKTWTDVGYWVGAKVSQNGAYALITRQDLADDNFYLNCHARFKLVSRCSWLESTEVAVLPFQDITVEIEIKKSDIPISGYITYYYPDTDQKSYSKVFGNYNSNVPISQIGFSSPVRKQSLRMDVKHGRLRPLHDKFVQNLARGFLYFVILTAKENHQDLLQLVGGVFVRRWRRVQGVDEWDSQLQFKPMEHYEYGPIQKFLRPWVHSTIEDPWHPNLLGCVICATPTQQVCGSCQETAYCSRDCQRADFLVGNHRDLCARNK